MILIYALGAYLVIGLAIAQYFVGNFYDLDDWKARGIIASLWPLVLLFKALGKL